MHVSTATAARGERSEDRVVTIARDDAVAVILADGAGGVSGGAMAADALRDAAVSHFERAKDWFDMRALSAVLVDVDRSANGETTAVMVVVAPYALVGVSVGDSEAWVIRARDVDRLTSSQDRSRLGSGRARPVVFHRRGLEGT